MAFVISDSASDRETLQAQVLAQAQAQLGWHGLVALRTVIDKRATFACLPQLQRPGMELGHGLWACGDLWMDRIRPPSKAPCAAACRRPRPSDRPWEPREKPDPPGISVACRPWFDSRLTAAGATIAGAASAAHSLQR